MQNQHRVLRHEDALAALGVFGRIVMASVIGFLLSIALTLIFEFVATDAIGERIYQVVDGQQEIITEYRYDETTTAPPTTTIATTVPTGDSDSQTTAAETAADVTTTPSSGLAADETTTTAVAATTTTLPQYKQVIRTPMPTAASVTLQILIQLLQLVLLVAIVYGRLWSMGDRDQNRVHYDKMTAEPGRGLRIGVLATIPWAVAYVLLLLSKLGLMPAGYVAVYRVLNTLFLPLINAVTFTVMDTRLVSWWALLVLLLTLAVVPVICHVAYRLGYRGVQLSEKLIYQSKRQSKDNSDV